MGAATPGAAGKLTSSDRTSLCLGLRRSLSNHFLPRARSLRIRSTKLKFFSFDRSLPNCSTICVLVSSSTPSSLVRLP